MRVAAHPAGKVVRAREFQRADVTRRRDLTSIEHFDDVELRRDALERGPAQVPATVAAEGVRHVRQPTLLVYEIDAAIGCEPRRHFLLEEETHELAIGGRDLLSDDHLKAGV